MASKNKGFALAKKVASSSWRREVSERPLYYHQPPHFSERPLYYTNLRKTPLLHQPPHKDPFTTTNLRTFLPAKVSRSVCECQFLRSRSTSQPNTGMRLSQSSSLLRAVTSKNSDKGWVHRTLLPANVSSSSWRQV
jgi:hypothetical protein